MGAQGTATLDFGSFPGKSDTTVTVTGQTSILSGSLVEAWIFPAATADHTADEHIVETIKVFAGNVIAGTGFTIYGINTSQLNEPVPVQRLALGNATGQQGRQRIGSGGGIGTLIYGKFNIGWVWN